MGRQKSSGRKPLSAVTKHAMRGRPILLAERSSFPCLFCEFKDSVHCHVNKRNATGSLKCSNCAESWRCNLSYSGFTLEPIEVYTAWVDAAVEAQQAARRGGEGPRPIDLAIIEGREIIAQRRAQNVARGRAVAENPGTAPGHAMARNTAFPGQQKRKPRVASPASQARRRKEIADAKAKHEKHEARFRSLEQQEIDDAEDEQKAIAKTRGERALPSPDDRALRSALGRSLGDTRHGGVGMSPVPSAGNLGNVNGSPTPARRVNAERAARKAVKHYRRDAYARHDSDDDVETCAGFAPEEATREGAIAVSSDEEAFEEESEEE